VVAHEDRAAVPVLGGVGRAAVEAVGVEHHCLAGLGQDPDLLREDRRRPARRRPRRAERGAMGSWAAAAA
jgi:hypothetical protein